VFTMDADTVVRPQTLTELIRELDASPTDRGAICARYWAKNRTGLARRLQQLEYTRYDDTRQLRGWRVQVASGAAVVYRQSALMQVIQKYRRVAPWDTTSLIEDYALTLDLKTLGYTVRAAQRAHVLTDTPATFGDLWQQRLRWGRGGIDECRRRGFTPATRRDIMSYFLFGASMIFRILWLVMVLLIVVDGLAFSFSLLGFIPLAVFWLERLTSAWRMKDKSWLDRLIVLSMIVEDAYGFFLEVCALVSIWYSLRDKRQAW
jgi:poly-beta-1,6-N-acetyl-D-glucosamine synthase